MKIRSDKKAYGKWFERFIPIYQHFGCGLNHEQYQRKRNTLIFIIYVIQKTKLSRSSALWFETLNYGIAELHGVYDNAVDI